MNEDLRFFAGLLTAAILIEGVRWWLRKRRGGFTGFHDTKDRPTYPETKALVAYAEYDANKTMDLYDRDEILRLWNNSTSLKNYTPAEIVLAEASYLEEAIKNNQEPGFPFKETSEFARGWSAAARWVRWHGEHEHLIISRLEKEGQHGTETAPATSPPGAP